MLGDILCHSSLAGIQLVRFMRADRLLSILLLLQTRGKMTASQLAEEMEVSRRTILRDIDALSSAGVPVYASGGHGGDIGLDEQYRTSLTGLNEMEIQTLFIASNPALLHDIGLGSAVKSSRLKLSAALPARYHGMAAHIQQRIYIDPSWWWHDARPLPFWEDLQLAVFGDRLMHTIYTRADGTVVERLLEPYSLVAKGSLWYLIARRESEFRLYRVSRFQQVILLETTFTRVADFDLETYCHTHSSAFINTLKEYTCTLRVHIRRINFIQGLMPGRYRIIELDSGDGWLTLYFEVESVELARMLVFELGQDVQVIEPRSLRESILRMAYEIIEHQAD